MNLTFYKRNYLSKLPSWDSVELKRDLMYKTILREKEINTKQKLSYTPA